jgi:hypothetical protein
MCQHAEESLSLPKTALPTSDLQSLGLEDISEEEDTTEPLEGHHVPI